MNLPHRLFTLAIIPLVAALSGCSDSVKPLPVANVSGTVTFNGKPLDKGTVTFSTDGRPPTVMDVVDGKFTGTAMVGSNKVSVSAMKKSSKSGPVDANYNSQMKAYAQNPPGGKRSDGGSGGSGDFGGEEMIPAEWSSASKQSRVVEAGGANKFDFDIKAK